MRTKDPETAARIRRCIDAHIRRAGAAPSIREIAAVTGISRPTVQRYLVAMGARGDISYEDGRIATDATEKLTTEQVTVPLIGEIACGLPNYAEEHVESYVRLPRAWVSNERCYLLRAWGDSMIEAGIAEGDLVLVAEASTARAGQIAVVLVGEETTLKRYYPEPEKRRIRLHPENHEMQDIYVESARVQGVALKVIKSLV